MKEAKKHISFVKSCIAFSEVTIPSISASPKQLNLYLETAEVIFRFFFFFLVMVQIDLITYIILILVPIYQVALVCDLVSHSDGLIDSALRCLQTLDLMDG